MQGLEFEPAKFTAGTIVTQQSHTALSEKVANETIVILKNVVDPDLAIRIRKAVHQWGLKTPPTNPNEPKACFHRIDENPPESQSKHIFHAYMFKLDGNDELVLDTAGEDFGMGEIVAPICVAMRNLQISLTGTTGTWLPDSDGRCFHPQIIHYPSGGGFLATHLHPYLPQKMGLILNLAQIKSDFDNGSTRFEAVSGLVDTEGHQLLGDICLFKYDLPHDISPVDETAKLDWSSERGRWTLIMPFY